jgi:hypothetical protein
MSAAEATVIQTAVEPTRYTPPAQSTSQLAAMSESAAVLSVIERAARDPNVDIAKLERLMDMKRQVEAVAARRAFNAAISQAKGEIPPIFKNKTVDFTSQKGRTNYRHEDFAEVARTVDPILNKHGLSYRFRSTQDGQKLIVTCILSHRDGYTEETSLTAAEDHSGNKNPLQAIGSAATYLQRYTLKLALGLAASTDDDGRATAAKDDPLESSAVSDEQVAQIRSLIVETATDIPAFLRYMKVERIEDIRADEFDFVMASFSQKKRKAQ